MKRTAQVGADEITAYGIIVRRLANENALKNIRRDEIGGALFGATNDVARGIGINADAGPLVPEGGAVRVDANAIAFHKVTVCAFSGDKDAVIRVAYDRVRREFRHAADRIRRRAGGNFDSCTSIVGDEIVLDDVALRRGARNQNSVPAAERRIRSGILGRERYCIVATVYRLADEIARRVIDHDAGASVENGLDVLLVGADVVGDDVVAAGFVEVDAVYQIASDDVAGDERVARIAVRLIAIDRHTRDSITHRHGCGGIGADLVVFDDRSDREGPGNDNSREVVSGDQVSTRSGPLIESIAANHCIGRV
ncbi:MAG: hypothetical protein ACREHD_07895 [Pirellulales bacterium]